MIVRWDQEGWYIFDGMTDNSNYDEEVKEDCYETICFFLFISCYGVF